MTVFNNLVTFEEVKSIEKYGEFEFEDLVNHKLWICLRCGQVLAEENDSEFTRKEHKRFHKQLDKICYKLGIS